MLEPSFLKYLESDMKEKIIRCDRMTGGDINDVYLLTTVSDQKIIKINTSDLFPRMFEAEAKGLQLLQKSKTFTIPDVFHAGTFENNSFLLLSYVSSGERSSTFWQDFGKQLAVLHQHTHSYFGLAYNNYIGSLPQYNTQFSNAAQFYITQRLEPQLKIAKQNGFSFSEIDRFFRNMETEIPDESAALIHGDLWSGNYLVDSLGNPGLIDPAIAYAPREMDIAMMHLFGGFNAEVFNVYQEVFPMEPGWKDRLSIWQLYYLLVHLNLFGESYYTSVCRIIEKYL